MGRADGFRGTTPYIKERQNQQQSDTLSDTLSKKPCKHLKNKHLQGFKQNESGETGIRTLDTLWGYTHFPGVLLKPLGHLSWLKTGHKEIKKIGHLQVLRKKLRATSCEPREQKVQM
jgi:hypothetical protein